MTDYIAIYNDGTANLTIKKTLITIGERPNVILIDLLLDGQCIALKNELTSMGFKVHIEDVNSFSLEDLSFKITTIIKQSLIDMMKEGKKYDGFYLEVGGLNHVMAGAMYMAAFRDGCTIVYLDEDGGLRKITFSPAPDVSHISYLPRITLDVLYENGRMDVNRLGRLIYADQLVGKNEEEVQEFFRQNHNTYKVLENLPILSEEVFMKNLLILIS